MHEYHDRTEPYAIDATGINEHDIPEPPENWSLDDLEDLLPGYVRNG